MLSSIADCSTIHFFTPRLIWSNATKGIKIEICLFLEWKHLISINLKLTNTTEMQLENIENWQRGGPSFEYYSSILRFKLQLLKKKNQDSHTHHIKSWKKSSSHYFMMYSLITRCRQKKILTKKIAHDCHKIVAYPTASVRHFSC